MNSPLTLYSLVLASFAAGLIIIYWLRTLDIHEKEPLFKMFLVTLFGGCISIIFSLILYDYFNLAGITDIKNIMGALLIIGPVEEGTKLLALFLLLFIIKNEMNEPTDGAIYMACVGLGFSLIENVLYAANSDMPWTILSLRLLTATPMHISFSIFMGLAFYFHYFKQPNNKALIASYIFASLTHGLYDIAIFSSIGVIFVFVFVWFARHWILTILGYSASSSPFRMTLKQFIHSNPAVFNQGIECLNCGDLNDKKTYKFEKIKIQHCASCDHYVTTKSSLYYLFRHFGSKFKNLSSTFVHSNIQSGSFSTLYNANHISDKKKIAYFKLDILDATLESLARETERALPKFMRKLLSF